MGMLNILVENRDQWFRLRRRLSSLGFHTPQGTPVMSSPLFAEGEPVPVVLSLDALCIRGKGRTFVLCAAKMWNHRRDPVITVADLLPILTRTCPPLYQFWWKLWRV